MTSRRRRRHHPVASRRWQSIAALSGITIILASCATAAEEISADLSTTMVSHHVVLGFPLGREAPTKARVVNQSALDFHYDATTLSFWSNYDTRDGQLHEVDVSLYQGFSFGEDLYAAIGFSHWAYPSDVYGDYDNVVIGYLSYSAAVDWEVIHYQILAHGPIEHGFGTTLGVSKGFSVFDGDRFTLSPTLSTDYLYDLIGVTGLGSVTGGVSLDVADAFLPSLALNCFLRRQQAVHDALPDLTYGGFTFGISF